MKVHILTENHAGGRLGAEHGISYFIEFKGKNILFDSGHTDLFIKNAEILGIDLIGETDLAVLSHGHWDHGNGFAYFFKLLSEHKEKAGSYEKKAFYAHPLVFQSRTRKGGGEELGLSFNQDELKHYFSPHLYDKALEILPGAWFLGEIPRLNGFEGLSTPYILSDGSQDLIPDDSGLLFDTENGLVLISGCAHSGICNMMEYAKKLTGKSAFRAVLGGFHLKTHNEQTRKTISYLENQEIDEIFPSHCTQLPALTAIHSAFGFPQLKTGMMMDFGF